jgi:S-methylmethionine-dependent homocysteine/selenocysteine methylase
VTSHFKEDSILDKGKTAKKFSEVVTSGIRSLHLKGFNCLSFKDIASIVSLGEMVRITFGLTGHSGVIFPFGGVLLPQPQIRLV